MINRTGDDWLRLFARRLGRLGVTVERGSADAVNYLSMSGDEAVTICDEAGATILFRETTPSASAVLEEFAHVLQQRAGHFATLDIREMQCRREIETGECLMNLGDRLPEAEQAATWKRLEWERGRLRRLERLLK